MNTEINGLQIRYRDEGTGPILLMLHGWGANIDLFDSLFRFASGKYRVVAMDMPGFGQSDEPKDPMNVDDYVDFVIAFVRKIGLDSAAAADAEGITLLGHSMGGRVIIKLMARIHDGIDVGFTVPRVILTDAAGIKPVPTKKQKRRTAWYHFCKNVIVKCGVLKLDPDALNKLQKKFGSADYSAASPIMRASLVKVVNEDLTPILKKVTVPALLIWGDQDTATPLADGKKMEEEMPEGGLAVIQGAGHYSFLDNPVLYQRILGSFLHI